MFNIFKINKISKMRSNLSNPKWLVTKYEYLLTIEKELRHFETFECSSFFRGSNLASHNRKVLDIRQKKYYKQLEFIKQLIKIKNTQYYLKYIGSISESELKVITRDNKISKICQR